MTSYSQPVINSQLPNHRLVELQLTIRKLAESQLATQKLLGLLGSQFTDTQLAVCILESLIKIAPGHCFGVTLANINR